MRTVVLLSCAFDLLEAFYATIEQKKIFKQYYGFSKDRLNSIVGTTGLSVIENVLRVI